MLMKYISTRLNIYPSSWYLRRQKLKVHIEGDILEDFYRGAHLDETRRKFLDGLKEGREGLHTSPVEEKCPVMKNKIGWRIEFGIFY